MHRSVALFLLAACAPTQTAPVDYGIDGDSLLELSGGRLDCIWGSTCNPKHAFRLPWYERNRDLANGINAVRGYDCDDEKWDGNEWVYRFNVQAPGTLSVELDAGEGVNAFVIATEQDYTCTAAGHATRSDVSPGTYWLIVDSKDGVEDTSYDLVIDYTEMAELDIADRYEPNDTPAQAHVIDLGWEESNTWNANLTPLSRVDYYTFVLEPLGTFMFDLPDPALEVEVVDSEGMDVGVYGSDRGWSIELYDEEYWETNESNTNVTFTLKVRMPDDIAFGENGVYEYAFDAGHDMP